MDRRLAFLPAWTAAAVLAAAPGCDGQTAATAAQGPSEDDAAATMTEPVTPRALVYRVVSRRIPGAVLDKWREHYGIEGDMLDRFGNVDYLNPFEYHSVPMAEGSFQETSPEGDGGYSSPRFALDEIVEMPDPPGADAAYNDVVVRLDNSDLHPEQRIMAPREAIPYPAVPRAAATGAVTGTARFAPSDFHRDAVPETGHTRLEMVRTGGKVEADTYLDTQVFFRFRMSAGVTGAVTGVAPLKGPGAEIKFALEPGGGASRIRYTLPQLQPVTTTPVMAQSEAEAACAKLHGGEVTAAPEPRRGVGEPAAAAPPEPDAVSTSVRLVYYAPAAAAGADRIWPFYACDGHRIHGEETIHLRTRLIAASTAPDAPSFGELEQAALDAGFLERDAPVPGAPSPAPAYPNLEIGIEWIGQAGNLSGSKFNAGGFYDTFAANGYNAKFNWGNRNAWEQDFKSTAEGGTDPRWADDVDSVFFTGHAGGNGFSFPGSNDDGQLHWRDARWGNEDLEWLFIAACGPLQASTGGNSWYERWVGMSDAFSGLHLLMGYANVSADNRREGTIIASSMLGVNGRSVTPVRHAWVKAAEKTQDSDVTLAYMGVYGAEGQTNFDDYFWGKASGGGPDIEPDEIVGAWRVSGPS